MSRITAERCHAVYQNKLAPTDGDVANECDMSATSSILGNTPQRRVTQDAGHGRRLEHSFTKTLSRALTTPGNGLVRSGAAVSQVSQHAAARCAVTWEAEGFWVWKFHAESEVKHYSEFIFSFLARPDIRMLFSFCL